MKGSMAGKNDEKWIRNYEALKEHVLETGHFFNKHHTLCNWAKYQRKRIKAGIMPDEQLKLFQELEGMRSDSHTGGRKKKIEYYGNG